MDSSRQGKYIFREVGDKAPVAFELFLNYKSKNLSHLSWELKFKTYDRPPKKVNKS